MKEIVVLGGGQSGRAFIEKIRETDSARKITLIDKNFNYSSGKDIINDFSLKNSIDLKNWAQSKNVEFIGDKVERINPKNRKIYFKESAVKEFDSLVIATGLKSKKLVLKGEHREGFFYLSQIAPVKLKGLLKISSEVTVYASTVLGWRLALTLNSLGKEVKIVADDWSFVEDEEKEKVAAFFKENNISVFLNTEIEEAIGEGNVKAVKILPLKVFSSQLLFVDSGFVPNYDFLEEGVTIRNNFFTQYEDIYFLGDAARQGVGNDAFFVYNYGEAEEGAGVLANHFLGLDMLPFQRKNLDFEEKRKVINHILRQSIKSQVF
jgi:NADPH-dependent 2,4-dienoyl-CoA reductase/sulfur reductase-like enzyme